MIDPASELRAYLQATAPGRRPIAGKLRELDSTLAAKRFPRISPWWMSTLERFYSARQRVLVLRVGRRGGKSSTLCRVAVCEALWGGHDVPAGDIGIVAIISVKREEAEKRLLTVKALLDAIGVSYEPFPSGIRLKGRDIAFQVFTASIAGVSGFTCICAICDEVSKWRDTDTGANPATEVLRSLRPTLSTMPHARDDARARG